MANKYPDYDWRGIAMLTQQLGQLFEPSKYEMMDRQQEHEMNMLMAKQAWSTKTAQIDKSETEYNNLIGQIDAQTTKLMEKDLGQLVNASMSEGSMPEQSSEIFNKTSAKKLSEINQLASDWRKTIAKEKETLANMKIYNQAAIAGEGFRKGTMTKKDKKGNVVDYYKKFDNDGLTGLSYEEEQGMLKSYIVDNYSLPEGEGMQINFGSGKNVESVWVKPEAIAFKAGFESNIGSGTGRGKAEKEIIFNEQAIKNAQDKLLGGKTFLKMSDEELLKSTLYNKQMFENIDKSNPDAEESLGLYMEMMPGGEFKASKMAFEKGFKKEDVYQYTSAYGNFDKGLREMLRRQMSLPGDVAQTSGILTKIGANEFQSKEILQDFKQYGANPDTLLMQVQTYKSTDSSKPSEEQLYNAYIDFLSKLTSMDSQKRRDGINEFTQIIGQ